MPKSSGKKFEEDFANSVPNSVFKQRLKDDMSGFKNVANICDYILYRYPSLYLLELKSHKGKSIPFDALREKQISGLFAEVGRRGVRAGFVFCFSDIEEVYYVKAEDVVSFINSGERKSFPIEWCREHGKRLEGEKARTRFKYNVDKFLDEI